MSPNYKYIINDPFPNKWSCEMVSLEKHPVDTLSKCYSLPAQNKYVMTVLVNNPPLVRVFHQGCERNLPNDKREKPPEKEVWSKCLLDSHPWLSGANVSSILLQFGWLCYQMVQ